MFYSMRIALLTCLASFSGMQAQDTVKEQLFSFLKGAAPVTLGMGVGYGVGYITGRPVNQQHAAALIGVVGGAIGGAVLDHCYCGGKEDKNQVARKSGIFLPIIIVACNRSGRILWKEVPVDGNSTKVEEPVHW